MRLSAIILALGSVLWGASPAMAVDGYKSLKFGMSMEQIVNEKICSFRALSDDEGGQYLECSDFSFGKSHTDAYAYFVNGKFVQLDIVLPDYKAAGTVIAGLTEKYGSPSSSSTEQELASIEQTPNAQVYVAFDKDTVYVLQESDEDRVQTASLVYAHPDAETLYEEKAKADISGDL